VAPASALDDASHPVPPVPVVAPAAPPVEVALPDVDAPP
jgi:hypothetical protein